MEQEIWRPVVGYEGHYEVSDLGRVRSVDRELVSHFGRRLYRRTYKGHILTPSLVAGRRWIVALSRPPARPHSYSVHLLVLLAFVGPRPAGCYGCRLDGDVNNNRLTNLTWRPEKSMPKGERHHAAKLTEQQVQSIRRQWALGEQPKELAQRFGVTPATIYWIASGKTWAHVS